jgi:RIO kinase 1
MRNKGIFKQINGCFAQGKEATLFHGTPGESTLFDNLEKSEYAIKIYKTTKIEFKDREKYVQGEWRFRFNKINKKTVAIPLWTEKEFRNLKRLKNNNILCPDPILLKKHILVMSFIGSNGRKAPQLGEITVNKEKWTNYYWECIQIMRNMYQLSGLVHGDLSSYNILVHEDKLWIIDLSQAVMYDHPRSSDFLKRDCENITKFFYNKNVTELMTIKELYIFILNKTIDSNNINHLIQEIKYQIIDKQKEGEYDPNPAEDIAWMKTYTPRTLIDIVDPFNINKNIDYVLEAYSKQ